MRYFKIISVLSVITFAIILPFSAPKAETKKDLDPELKGKVEDAIIRGKQVLVGLIEKLPDYKFDLKDHNGMMHNMRYDEIVLYTLAHCGAMQDEEFQALLERTLENPLDRTYHVVLQAMALEAIDKQAYEARIADCAQYLVDTQCSNGQWSYGLERPSENWKKIRYGKAVVTGPDKKGPTPPPKDVRIIPGSGTKSVKLGNYKAIQSKKLGGPSGDNSNTQYAILGLRACKETQVFIPEELWKSSKKWFESTQDGEGGWGYAPNGDAANSPAYGSMTAGAMGSLYITKFYLGEFKELKSAQEDKYIKRAMGWVIKNYTVSTNPKTDRQDYFFYYLYAMERAGVFAGIEKFGGRDWYVDGCTEIVNRQESSGMWNKGSISDTCFAMLFLKMATKPLKAVITGTGGK
ncbi:MAG: hypothetical protein WC980_09600 [Candidatus Brocadiia bacterium]